MRRMLVLFLAALAVAGCDTTQWFANFFGDSAETPPAALVGDPVHGEDIFRHGINAAPPCITCHALAPGGFSLGPVMQGFGERAGSSREGLTAEAYAHESIVDPTVFIVSGFRNIMYPGYGTDLTEQEIADLIAFLMAQ
jgi:mono/diheme cytochrome c family protein